MMKALNLAPLACLAFLVSTPLTSRAETIFSVADAGIREVNVGNPVEGPNFNTGSETSLYLVGMPSQHWSQLVRFDLSAYAGRTVLGPASFKLYLNNGWGGESFPTQTVDVKQVLVAWNESTVTWNNFGGDPGVQGDEVGPSLASLVVNAGTHQGSYVSWTVSSAVVQSWIDNHSTNFGFLVEGATNDFRQDLNFSSREGAHAPILEFTTDVPLPAAAWGVLGLLGLVGTDRRRRAE
jgi:hypothetical protein